MSTRYCILLCAASILRERKTTTDDNTFLLPTLLQRLVSLVYRSCSQNASAIDIDLVDPGRVHLHCQLQDAVVKFVAACHSAATSLRETGHCVVVSDVPPMYAMVRINKLLVLLKSHSVPIPLLGRWRRWYVSGTLDNGSVLRKSCGTMNDPAE